VVHSNKPCITASARRCPHISVFEETGVKRGQNGQSMIQLIIVVAVMMILAAIAVPNINQTIAAERLRTSAGDLSGLMQQARLLATKSNTYIPIRFGNANGVPIAYADVNGDAVWEVVNPQEPATYFSPRVFPTAGAPPAPYVLVGDSGAGAFPGGTALAFSPRGLPCAYVPGPPLVCTTPAAQYFTFYITDNRPSPGWAVVVVTKGGRSKVQIWRGNAWGN
jgi:type II secretory pathway pseudopilin PulG